MKTIQVNDCNNCPFAGLHDSILSDNCENHCRATDDLKDLYRDENVKSDNYGALIQPEWCPLKSEEINVIINP